MDKKINHHEKEFRAKPFTYPQPVFIIAAYDENHILNAMNGKILKTLAERGFLTIAFDPSYTGERIR